MSVGSVRRCKCGAVETPGDPFINGECFQCASLPKQTKGDAQKAAAQRRQLENQKAAAIQKQLQGDDEQRKKRDIRSHFTTGGVLIIAGGLFYFAAFLVVMIAESLATPLAWMLAGIGGLTTSAGIIRWAIQPLIHQNEEIKADLQEIKRNQLLPR